MRLRRLVLVLGDQLDARSSALDDFDPAQDALWMAEAPAESTRVWSHQARIALFLAAMRHFRDEQRALGRTVHYRELDAHDAPTLGAALEADVRRLRPAAGVLVVEPGEWGVAREVAAAVAAAGLALETRPDRHFLCSREEFARWARGRRELRLEHFYRWMRRRTGVLLDGDAPAGGDWNFDRANRGAFGSRGPGFVPAPLRFEPDACTRGVLELVARRFGEHPGELGAFDWPVTRAAAQAALADFVAHRLPGFGRWQDAMWTGEPWLYHSRLSAALNLRLLDPREVLDAAEAAFREGRAPIESVEGFVRQVLGWREYVRGFYWREMPGLLERNALGADAPLPDWYWNGATDMACLAATLRQTLAYGYAHHIQRLMITGLWALLAGIRPRAVHEWYLAIYVDAVEWVELPNTYGMALYADGGLLASKPYAASGKYIQRMSDYCRGCRYDPARAGGAGACPFTTLYWDFLARHRERFAAHPRLALQVRNLVRLAPEELARIRARATRIRSGAPVE